MINVNIESDLNDKDILFLLKNGCTFRQKEKSFDYIVGYVSNDDGSWRHNPTYGVTFSIKNNICYVTFNWGDEYIQEIFDLVQQLSISVKTFFKLHGEDFILWKKENDN
jgi:hypothetical protein